MCMPKGAGETNLHVYFPIGGKRKHSSVCGASRWREVDMLDRWIQISPAAASDCRDKPEPHCSRAEQASMGGGSSASAVTSVSGHVGSV